MKDEFNGIVKVGKRKAIVQPGDFIMYNGINYQFFAGDGRALYWRGFNKMSYIKLTDAAVRKIPFDKLRMVERESEIFIGKKIKEWYF